MISEALQQSFMDTKRSTSNLPWIWVIETLATSNEIDTSLLIDLVKRTPEVSDDDMGRNARELVSLRVLESLSVQEVSNASNNDASVPSDKIELDRSVRCEDVLRHLFLGVLSDRKMAGPEVSKWDVQSFITKKRSCLPKCALQQIKDTIVDTTNPLSTSLKAKSGLKVGSHSRDGDCFNAVDSNGTKQSREIRGGDGQHEHVLPSGNATPCLGGNTNGLQENQPRTLVLSKRRIDASTAHEGEHIETEHISENSSDTCIKASKRCKQEVISPRHDALHDFESSQIDGVATELSAQIPQAIVQKGNLENGALVGALDGSCEDAASKMVRQNIDTCSHDDLLPERMISEEKIQNVESSSKACDELRTSSGSPQQVIHQDSHTHGTEDHQECNRGNLFKDEPSEVAKKNIVGSDEPEFSSDSDGYHNEKTGLSVKRIDFVNSQCAQGQDSLTTENGRELNLCVKCNEGGQLLICNSDTCPLVVHQSCLGSVPSFDNGRNFYCPFCAYSRAISENLECKKMSSLARKDLAAFVGVGARRQSKKSSHSSRRKKKNGSREDEELCHERNNKDILNDEVKEARSAPVGRNSLDGKIMETPSPQAEASVPHHPEEAGQTSKKSPHRSHGSKQKLSREEEELCHNEDSKKNSLNQVQEEPENAPVSNSSANAEVTQTGSPQAEASAPPELVSRQSTFVEESSEDEDTIASRYCVRFRNSDKNYFFKFAVPILQFLK
ncbi:uncharacterized protein LOC132051490 isoform X2 [Lycium ferocissimum]|uniref:uncharacterized protein LOC132051490 isoform X2 n=1 Tax=Lycium ferocissimum TaxID=112874 RepID=UPI00281637FA|nr:uncharacterized protein LOC132051490 isoform X2 [Lycium ferocissimum]